MNSDMLHELEHDLAVSLPSHYRIALLNDPLKAELPEAYITDFVSDKEQIVRMNELNRSSGYYGKGWPKEAFWIGDDGGGGAYFIMIRANDQKIYYIDWENQSHTFDDLETLISASSFREFLIQARQRTIDTIIECEGEFNTANKALQ